MANVGGAMGELGEASQRVNANPAVPPEPAREALGREEVFVRGLDALAPGLLAALPQTSQEFNQGGSLKVGHAQEAAAVQHGRQAEQDKGNVICGVALGRQVAAEVLGVLGERSLGVFLGGID